MAAYHSFFIQHFLYYVYACALPFGFQFDGNFFKDHFLKRQIDNNKISIELYGAKFKFTVGENI